MNSCLGNTVINIRLLLKKRGKLSLLHSTRTPFYNKMFGSPVNTQTNVSLYECIRYSYMIFNFATIHLTIHRLCEYSEYMGDENIF